MKNGIIPFFLTQKKLLQHTFTSHKKCPQYEIDATVLIRPFLLKAFPVQRLAQWLF